MGKSVCLHDSLRKPDPMHRMYDALPKDWLSPFLRIFLVARLQLKISINFCNSGNKRKEAQCSSNPWMGLAGWRWQKNENPQKTQQHSTRTEQEVQISQARATKVLRASQTGNNYHQAKFSRGFHKEIKFIWVDLYIHCLPPYSRHPDSTHPE